MSDISKIRFPHGDFAQPYLASEKQREPSIAQDFHRFQLPKPLLTQRDAKSVLNLKLLRHFHVFCQWLDLHAESAKM